MNFGLSETTCATIRRILERHPEVEKAIIYGSRAKGNYRKGSDIDLTMLGEALNTRTLFAVADELDESYIPYTVDLSILARIDNPELRGHIDRVGAVLYERGGTEDGAESASGESSVDSR